VPLKVCKTGLKADFKAASCVFNLICLRLTNRCQVPRHGVISDGILRSASVALKSMSYLGLKVVEASFMKIFTQQGMSLPLKPPVSRFVATALASRKTGQHASVELACSAAGLLFVSALKMVCLVFGLLRFSCLDRFEVAFQLRHQLPKVK